jgi:hypothetical protein
LERDWEIVTIGKGEGRREKAKGKRQKVNG